MKPPGRNGEGGGDLVTAVGHIFNTWSSCFVDVFPPSTDYVAMTYGGGGRRGALRNTSIVFQIPISASRAAKALRLYFQWVAWPPGSQLYSTSATHIPPGYDAFPHLQTTLAKHNSRPSPILHPVERCFRQVEFATNKLL